MDCEIGRHKVYNFAMDTLDPKVSLQKLDIKFDSLKCAAKLNVAFGFVLKSVEDRNCRYYHAPENKTLLGRFELVATTEDLTKVKNLLSHTDVRELCTRERANTKWKFHKLTNVKEFAALLKGVPMGCKDTVLPNPTIENHSVKCFTFEENAQRPYNAFYVSLELWCCICTEMRDSRWKLPDYSTYSWKKMMGLILQTSEVFVQKKLPQWRILFRQTFLRQF